MADNAAPFYAALADWMRQAHALDIAFDDAPPWRERQHMLYRGEAHLGFVCGLPFIEQLELPEPPVELLAAPVMRAERYLGLPIYFSDVIVRRDSAWHSFGQLRGCSWAYNEPNSQSGYNLTRYHLAQLGEIDGFFGDVVESGAHQTSLRMVVDGRVDASSIDSTVLETELENHPHLAAEIRVVATLGPSPAPPALVARGVEPALKAELRRILLDMHRSDSGAALLHRYGRSHFAAVTNQDYEVITNMARAAREVALGRRLIPA